MINFVRKLYLFLSNVFFQILGLFGSREDYIHLWLLVGASLAPLIFEEKKFKDFIASL